MTLRAILRRLTDHGPANQQEPGPFGPEQSAYVLERAYVPEHIPGLMAGISHATPLLVGDFLCFAAEDSLIFVGYPLEGEATAGRCAAAVTEARSRLKPHVLWFIGPQIPPDLEDGCRDRQSDVYYRLELPASVKPSARRAARSAAAALTVHAGRVFGPEHQAVTDELLARQPLPPMVAVLYRSMPDYIGRTASATVLEARTPSGALAAYFVVEEAARAFDAYVLGAFSRRNYVPYASDLLFATMIERAQARGKPALDLGLGVNDGIRRFKEKWGGQPYLAYESCECRFDRGADIIDGLSELRV